MAKHFSETRDELQLSAILCQDDCQRLMLHPFITAAKASMVSEVRIQVFSIMCVVNTCI